MEKTALCSVLDRTNPKETPIEKESMARTQFPCIVMEYVWLEINSLTLLLFDLWN